MNVSSSTRELVWNQRIDCQRLIQYYAQESAKRAAWQTGTQFGLLAASLGATTSALQVLPDEWIVSSLLDVSLPLIVALGVVMSLTWNHPNRIAQLHTTSGKCRSLGIGMEALWSRLEMLDDETAGEEIVRLAKQLEEATAPVEAAGIRFSRHRNEQAERAAQVIVSG